MNHKYNRGWQHDSSRWDTPCPPVVRSNYISSSAPLKHKCLLNSKCRTVLKCKFVVLLLLNFTLQLNYSFEESKVFFLLHLAYLAVLLMIKLGFNVQNIRSTTKNDCMTL